MNPLLVNSFCQPATLRFNQPAGNGIGMSNTLRALRNILVIAACIGGAQAASAQQEEPKKHHEIRYQMTISTTPPATQRCKASLDFTFIQKNDTAVIESTLSNPDCGASSGEYTMLIRIRDENGELQSLQFPESWQRENAQTIESHAEYFIGDNVDLVSARARKLQCICDGSGEEATAPEE